eukprot:1137998-Pelagomonas_calceolata.AAC.1
MRLCDRGRQHKWYQQQHLCQRQQQHAKRDCVWSVCILLLISVRCRHRHVTPVHCQTPFQASGTQWQH